MFGWRGKIGLLVPANNTVMEPEIFSMLPVGVSLYSTRMIIEGAFEPDTLHRMEKQSVRGIEELLFTGVDVIVYSCMATSLAKGSEWDKEFCGQVVKPEANILTAALSTVEAIKSMQAEKISILSPYPEAIHPLVVPYFESHSISIVAHKSLNISDYRAVTQVAPEIVYREACNLDTTGSKALCILATDIETVKIIPFLEQYLGIPVISTNLAIYWSALEALGVKDYSNAADCKLLQLR
jgi:maleate isomerase